MRKIFSPNQKAIIAIEAVKGLKTTNQIGSHYEAHPTQVGIWKKQLTDRALELFTDKRNPENKNKDDLIDRLYKIIGQRDIEIDWLKKNCTLTHNERASAIDHDFDISIARQAELLGISRGSIYYKRVVDERDIEIMHAIDTIFTSCPFYGSRRIKKVLEQQNIFICREHVSHLMQLMGLEAIYPKQRSTSIANKQHKKYPYLLKNLAIVRPNQVWGTDITYVRLENGFCYLVAHLDWFSRYVVAWELSESLETAFCIASLERACATAVPDIHNSDQGVQYTSEEYTNILRQRDIEISMDGRGRRMDNIFTERLWRTIKYENIFLKSYRNIDEACVGLHEYFPFYNTQHPHQSLKYRTPARVYFG